MTKTMDIDEPESQPHQPSPSCHIAIVGSQHQRVAKVIALLDAEKYRTCIVPLNSAASQHQQVSIDIQYLPCIATFDSYENEQGDNVRYLVKLEYYDPKNIGAFGGKSLAPFFDEVYSVGAKDGEDKEDFVRGMIAFAIGCGIENDEDVHCIQRFLETLSSSCASQIISEQKIANNDSSRDIIIECLKPNPEYASLAEENKAFREMNEKDRKQMVANGFMGPGKMANFAFHIAQKVVRKRFTPENNESKRSLTDILVDGQETSSLQVPIHLQYAPIEIHDSESHTPNSDMSRYACRICRHVLFREEDQEDPPHSHSLHDFRKKRQKVGCFDARPCQNYCITEPLPWMNGCSDVEGKLHCPKCKTKVGHYSWTGAQCSCGTWITPAIMIPMSKVDEMKPIASLAAPINYCFADSQPSIPSDSFWNDSSNSMDVA